MPNKEITKNSQARMMRSWMLGLHATHITDIGGRLGYFAEMRRRSGTASAEELAQALELDPWRTKVWCQAACAVGVLQAEGDTQFTFAPFMGELLGDTSPELLTTHVLASLSRDFPAYPEAFRTGALKTFHDHDEDFFYHQGKISALRAPVVVAAARKLSGMEDRLRTRGKVMDIGSGSGSVIVRFAEEFPACQVTGIEPLPYFSETSRKLIQDKRLSDRVQVESVGGEELPFENEFDLITMVQVFHELPDEKKLDILVRCHRSLKPGGVLLVVDRCAPETGEDLHDRRFTMSILEQWFEVTWGNIVNTRSDILQMLEDTGFSVTDENPDIIPTYWTFVAEKTA